MLHRFVGGVLAVGLATGGGLGLVPAIAQSIAQANFGTLRLAPGFSPNQGQVQGRTGGRTSLPATVAERDRNGEICLGYGSAAPDYILELDGNFEQLHLQVNSGGNDTTLLVRGPSGVLCGDDIARNNPDDEIRADGWRSGEYEVWVGTSNPGERFNYTLVVSE